MVATAFGILFFMVAFLAIIWFGVHALLGGSGGQAGADAAVKAMWQAAILAVVCLIIGFILI